jgi:carboxymethylenebutenolidase
MERKSANEYPQELLDLFHEYQHGDMDRRSFMAHLTKFAVGGLTAAAIFESLTPNYAWAQTVDPNDKQIKVGYETVQSPEATARSRVILHGPQRAKSFRRSSSFMKIADSTLI